MDKNTSISTGQKTSAGSSGNSPRVGDVVVFRDQAKNLRKDCILGGILMEILGDKYLVHRGRQILAAYPASEMRKIEAEDIEPGPIEVV